MSVFLGKNEDGVLVPINIPLDIDKEGLATETTLAALNEKVTELNGKVDACDTDGLATQATLVALNGKVNACDTSGLATQATLLDINNKITKGNNDTLDTAQQTLVYGRDTQGTIRALQNAPDGPLNVYNLSPVAVPQYKVLINSDVDVTNAVTLGPGGSSDDTWTSDSFDKGGGKQIYILMQYDNNTGFQNEVELSVTVSISNDGTRFYETSQYIILNAEVSKTTVVTQINNILPKHAKIMIQNTDQSYSFTIKRLEVSWIEG